MVPIFVAFCKKKLQNAFFDGCTKGNFSTNWLALKESPL
jgi:hypothetical protein